MIGHETSAGAQTVDSGALSKKGSGTGIHPLSTRGHRTPQWRWTPCSLCGRGTRLQRPTSQDRATKMEPDLSSGLSVASGHPAFLLWQRRAHGQEWESSSGRVKKKTKDGRPGNLQGSHMSMPQDPTILPKESAQKKKVRREQDVHTRNSVQHCSSEKSTENKPPHGRTGYSEGTHHTTKHGLGKGISPFTLNKPVGPPRPASLWPVLPQASCCPHTC